MKVDVIQTSFAGGEFGASLLGRTDIVQYANACETVQNFLIRSYGSAISTPGTDYIATVSDSTLKTRLIKFVFNRTDAYVIEMGEKYFRFYTSGGQVITTGTTPMQIAHIYTEDELFDVQFTQLNDIMWFTHPDHPPQRLVRTSAFNWTIADFDFLGGPFKDVNTEATTLAASATTGTVNVTGSTTGIFTLSSGSTKGHVDSYWSIGGLAQTNTTTGLQETGYVKITHVIDSATATATVIKNLKVATATTIWAEGAWSAVRGYPARVTFHERRLWMARTKHEPQKVWGSKIYLYDEYALDTAADDDGLNLALASNESNEIQWLASGKSLLAGTYGGAFVINSGSTEPLTPANARAEAEVSYGAEALPPRRIGNFFYYIQRFGKKIRELFYFWDLDSYKAVDRTILSPHILADGVIQMDVQQEPESLLYCVLTNGTLATLTREIDQEVTAWAKQTTNGTYTSIAIIPSQTNLYEEVWVIVERWINGVQKKYVELFDSIEPPDRQDYCNYLHSSLRFDAFLTATASAITISLSATTGSITVTASGPAFDQDDVGDRLRAMSADYLTILGEGKITATAGTTGCTLAITLDFDALAYAVNRWGVSVTTVSGLDHLETEEVAVLADGGTDKPTKTVATGAITLGYNYFVVNVGLAYDQVIKTLPKEAGSERGTSQAKKQRISEVAFKVNRSHKGFQFGDALDNLDKVKYRDPSTDLGTPELLFTGILPNNTFRGNYVYGAQMFIKNSDPLPLELLSIISTLETFDK